jgi:hypothetical protein
MLFRGQFKHEIRRKPISIAPDSTLQRSSVHTIELGQVHVEQDLLTANQQYPSLDGFGGHNHLAPSHLSIFARLGSSSEIVSVLQYSSPLA